MKKLIALFFSLAIIGVSALIFCVHNQVPFCFKYAFPVFVCIFTGFYGLTEIAKRKLLK